MHIVVVNGSPRKSGRTGIVARHIAKQYGAQLIDLSEGAIPLYNGEAGQEELPAVCQLREQIQQADGIVLCSPEYHSAMSGALKNSLDFFKQRSIRTQTSCSYCGGRGRKRRNQCLKQYAYSDAWIACQRHSKTACLRFLLFR